MNVTLMVPRAPSELTTGNVAKNVPVMVIFGFVADSVPVVGCTTTVVLVPTSEFKVAHVSVAAKLA